MFDYGTLSIVLTGLGIIGAIIYYSLTLRNANKTRELQIFMNIARSLNSEETQKTWAELMNADFTDYDDYMSKYDSSVDPEFWGKRGAIWWNYNAVGYLLMDGYISIDLVHKLLGILAVLQWRKWGGIILEIRESQGLSNYFTGFEYLVNEILKYEKEHHD